MPQDFPHRTPETLGTSEFQAQSRPLYICFRPTHGNILLFIYYFNAVIDHGCWRGSWGSEDFSTPFTYPEGPLSEINEMPHEYILSEMRSSERGTHNFPQFPMKDIIQMSTSDRWSNNLHKRAPYTLRCSLYSEVNPASLKSFTQVPSGVHILCLKLQINPDLPQKCLPRVCLLEKWLVSPLWMYLCNMWHIVGI